MKKIISALFVLLIVTSLFNLSVYAAESSYSDTENHWAESSIKRWSKYGIIQGSNDQFDPDGQLTCAQLATIFAKLLRLPAAQDAGFIDNTSNAWYYDAINRCTAAGILSGNGDGTVTPNTPVSRERAMVMLARALGIEPLNNVNLTQYTDAAQVSLYAQGYVAALVEIGIVGGVTDNQLAPLTNISRASIVTILDRAIGTYANSAGEKVSVDGELMLVVADNVTVSGEADKLLISADGVKVAVSSSKNIKSINITGNNSKVVLDNSTADEVTLSGTGAEIEAKNNSVIKSINVTTDAVSAIINAGNGTVIKNIKNYAANVAIIGNGMVKTVSSNSDLTVETANTEIKNTSISKITVTDKTGKNVSVDSGSNFTTSSTPSDSSNNRKPHYHSYIGKITKESTCTEAGLKAFICDCGSSYVERISPLGHDFDKTTRICSRCGMTVVTVVDGMIDLYSFAAKNEVLSDEASIIFDSNNEYTLNLEKGTDISSWFTGVPDGIHMYYQGITSYRLLFKIGGTPTKDISNGSYDLRCVIPENTLYVDEVLYPFEITPRTFVSRIFVCDSFSYINLISSWIEWDEVEISDNIWEIAASLSKAVRSSENTTVVSVPYGVSNDEKTIYLSIGIQPDNEYKFTKDIKIDLSYGDFPYQFGTISTWDGKEYPAKTEKDIMINIDFDVDKLLSIL